MKQFINDIPILGSLIKTIIDMIISRNNRKTIKVYLKENEDLRIVIGASNIFQDGWCPTDIDNLNLLRTGSFNSLLGKRKACAFIAEHVWEHLSLKEAEVAAVNCYSYLKRGGYMRIAVPDGFHKNKSYIEAVKVGGTGLGSDDHKVLYNYKTLSKVFSNAGFRVKLLEYFDEENNFQFTKWNKDQGMIHRSERYDSRNKQEPLTYTSIIIDVFKD